jgi:hypothetical protein
MTPQDAREVARYVEGHRANDGPFDLVVAGETPGEDRDGGARIVAAYEEAGVTWWVESIDPWRFGWTEGEPWPSGEMRRRVRQGPPEACGTAQASPGSEGASPYTLGIIHGQRLREECGSGTEHTDI